MSTAGVRGTRWGRALPLIVLSLAAIAAMSVLVARNVLAAQVTMQNGTFQFASTRVAGTNTAFGIATANQQDGTNKKVLRTSMKTATLNGFCLSKVQTVPGVGDVTFRFQSGDGDASTSEFTATNVLFDVDGFRSTGVGMVLKGNVQMGISAQDVQSTGTDNPLDVSTALGAWAIQSPDSSISEMRGLLRSATLPVAAIPGMKITAKVGGAQCNDTGEALPK